MTLGVCLFPGHSAQGQALSTPPHMCQVGGTAMALETPNPGPPSPFSDMLRPRGAEKSTSLTKGGGPQCIPCKVLWAPVTASLRGARWLPVLPVWQGRSGHTIWGSRREERRPGVLVRLHCPEQAGLPRWPTDTQPLPSQGPFPSCRDKGWAGWGGGRPSAAHPGTGRPPCRR